MEKAKPLKDQNCLKTMKTQKNNQKNLKIFFRLCLYGGIVQQNKSNKSSYKSSHIQLADGQITLKMA